MRSGAQHGGDVMGAPLVLVIGGARSGKSRYAEGIAHRSDHPVSYIATAGPPRDAEMRARIDAHRVRRPAGWVTVEAPDDLPAALDGCDGLALIDCMTLWLSNLMLAERDIAAATTALLEALARRSSPTIAVSNEVGEGVVPATSLGRRFRDAQGVLNQHMAAAARDVVKVVAGCPVIIKPSPQPEHLL